jgi:CheY-like chemotaxis protein
MGGRTFLQQLRAYWQAACLQQSLPAVVVITAEASGANAASLGVEQVIAKPFHVRDLLEVVRSLTS